MKAKQYTEEQIIAVLKEGEAGAKIADLCRKYGMSVDQLKKLNHMGKDVTIRPGQELVVGQN